MGNEEKIFRHKRQTRGKSHAMKIFMIYTLHKVLLELSNQGR
jgi:hypothetical protein